MLAIGSNKSEISIPINIPVSSVYNRDLVQKKETQEYSLDCSIFNPGKMSPPDPWKSRLQNRLHLCTIKSSAFICDKGNGY